MSKLSLRQVVNNYGGIVAVNFNKSGRLSIKEKLFNGRYNLKASLRRRLEELTKTLWGVADLHAHPAANFGFGAEADGWGGVIWGQPGKAHDNVDFDKDLPPCDASIHASPGAMVGPVRKLVREILLGQLEKEWLSGHGRAGYSSYTRASFANWPSALSRTHQRMHISWIRRAWRGGLRLMVASTVDNQVIKQLWHAPWFTFDPNFDFISATIQLSKIRELVEENKSWMKIVTSADEAYQAIKDDKLAIVLGVEMDQLTADNIIVLKETQGVRLVTPIHLVNNSFGGAAIYDGLFNISNLLLTGSFFEVDFDKNIDFRLTQIPTGDLNLYGISIPNPLSVYPDYGTPNQGGHKNKIGLKSISDLRKLMSAGLLIDIHHMSDKCIDSAINLAETVADPYKYPLLKTHTGLRFDSGSGDLNENSLKREHARKIFDLGGMVGIGVGHKDLDDPIADWFEQYDQLMKLDGAIPTGLGTDMNGLDIHIDRSEVDIDYPLDNLCPNIGNHQQQVTLNPNMNTPFITKFEERGFSHYGMMPEFLHAVNKLDQDAVHIHEIFSSAHAFVKTWERVEEAQNHIT